jgi:myo-inositol catabolism protein IolS
VFDCLDRLRVQGKIRCYGVTNVAPEELRRHIGREGLVSFSLQYSLAHRESEEAIGRLCGMGLTFLSWGSLGQGILSGRYAADHQWPENDRRRRPQYGNFHGQRLHENMVLVKRLREIALLEDYPGPGVVALRFILDQFANSVAIAGVKARAQIAENARAGEGPMSAASFRHLAAEIAAP